MLFRSGSRHDIYNLGQLDDLNNYIFWAAAAVSRMGIGWGRIRGRLECRSWEFNLVSDFNVLAGRGGEQMERVRDKYAFHVSQ